MVSSACPFAVSSAQSPQAFPLNSPPPHCQTGWAGYQWHCKDGRRRPVLVLICLHPRSQPTVRQLFHKELDGRKELKLICPRSVWVNVDPRWSTELLHLGLAWGTLSWVRASLGMQLVWNVAQGPRGPTAGRTLEKGRAFLKRRDYLHL